MSAKQLEALKLAQELIRIAHKYFPKSIRNRDTFTLCLTDAAINTALRDVEAA